MPSKPRLADILLPGTEEHYRPAAQEATDPAGGAANPHGSWSSDCTFIRTALDLDSMLGEVMIPLQRPTRTQGRGGRKKEDAGAGGNNGTKGYGNCSGLGAGALGNGRKRCQSKI